MTSPRPSAEQSQDQNPILTAIISGSVKKLREINKTNWSHQFYGGVISKFTYFTKQHYNAPLFLAIYYGQLSIVKYLFEERQIEINAEEKLNVLKETALHGHLAILKYLIEKRHFGLDPSLLTIAIHAGQLSVAQDLVYKKAVSLWSLRGKDRCDSLIKHLIKNNYFDVLQWLVDKHHFPLRDRSE